MKGAIKPYQSRAYLAENLNQVRRGDTLWELAEEINSAKEDPRIIIAAIKKVNNIGSSLTINQKIIIPGN